MCVYIYIYMYLSLYIYMCMYVCVYMYIYTHVYVNTPFASIANNKLTAVWLSPLEEAQGVPPH